MKKILVLGALSLFGLSNASTLFGLSDAGTFICYCGSLDEVSTEREDLKVYSCDAVRVKAVLEELIRRDSRVLRALRFSKCTFDNEGKILLWKVVAKFASSLRTLDLGEDVNDDGVPDSLRADVLEALVESKTIDPITGMRMEEPIDYGVRELLVCNLTIRKDEEEIADYEQRFAKGVIAESAYRAGIAEAEARKKGREERKKFYEAGLRWFIYKLRNNPTESTSK